MGYFETWAEVAANYVWPLNMMRGRPDAGERISGKTERVNKMKASGWNADTQ